jgi:hypothetical protein
MLTIVDEPTRECLSIDVARRLTSEGVLERRSDLSSVAACRGAFAATIDLSSQLRVREWLEGVEVKTLFIEPGSL